MIAPITLSQQQQVTDRVANLLVQCEALFDVSLKPIDSRFDLRGRTSGMYVIKHRQRYLRFNPFIFAKYFEDSLATTVPHEVAHYVSDVIFGFKNILPHGNEWKAIMQSLGVEPQVTGNYDLSGIVVRQQRRFSYNCGCMEHELTSVRHNRIVYKNAHYLCRKCGLGLTRSAGV
ncbi:MAG: SprT-like domain-containing protein [Ectothiorhodospiraceae bacterium]|nr:SprT-like domain-containing protein [Ectothiorhodospiraceae bacterium]